MVSYKTRLIWRRQINKKLLLLLLLIIYLFLKLKEYPSNYEIGRNHSNITIGNPEKNKYFIIKHFKYVKKK